MAPDLAWCYVKFIYSEKVTKFEKKISQFYLQKDLLTSNKIGEFFSNFSGLLGKHELYTSNCRNLERIVPLKFGLSEKNTKFEKIFLMILTIQMIYLLNVKTIRKIFSNYVCFSESPNFSNCYSENS
jgi:hypothetical protein